MTDVIERLTNESVELLQAMIRNECVNEGTPESGHEERNADLLLGELDGLGLDIQTFETLPGRKSLVARYPGTDPDAPALCLMGHTDVVPVNPDGWDEDPFGGELIGGEVWGRGAVDMLNVTASMAVAFREVVRSGKRYPGDIVYFAVADEEHGGELGARVLIEEQWDALRCDFVLTEYGGTPITSEAGTFVLLTSGEKGSGGRRITVHGEPGHGSMPFGVDSALIKAAEIVRRLAAYDPGPRIDDTFSGVLKALGLPSEVRSRLLDPGFLADTLAAMPPGLASGLHSSCHMSFSPNVLTSGAKSNVIPDRAELIVDIRILPGDTQEDVDAHLRAAIGDDLLPSVAWAPLFPDQDLSATSSPTGTKLWNAVADAVTTAYPGAEVVPSMVTAGTDARFFRQRGVPAYGAGLLSPEVPLGEFMNRFHGHNERIDIASMRLTTKLWLDVLDRLWA